MTEKCIIVCEQGVLIEIDDISDFKNFTATVYVPYEDGFTELPYQIGSLIVCDSEITYISTNPAYTGVRDIAIRCIRNVLQYPNILYLVPIY